MIYAGVEEQKKQAHREGFGRGRREGRATLVWPAGEGEVRWADC